MLNAFSGIFKLSQSILTLLSTGWFLLFTLVTCFLSLFSNPLVSIPRVKTVIGIPITLMARLFVQLFAFFHFHTRIVKSAIWLVVFISWWLTLGLVFWPGLGDPFISQSPREFYAFHFLERFLFSHKPFVGMMKFQFLVQFPVDYLPQLVGLILILLICCIQLLCDQLFHLHHHVTYT